MKFEELGFDDQVAGMFSARIFAFSVGTYFELMEAGAESSVAAERIVNIAAATRLANDENAATSERMAAVKKIAEILAEIAYKGDNQ